MYSMMEKKIFWVLIFKYVDIENSNIDILLYLEFFFVHGMLLYGKKIFCHSQMYWYKFYHNSSFRREVIDHTRKVLFREQTVPFF